MPNRLTTTAGKVLAHLAGSVPAGLRQSLRTHLRSSLPATLAGLLAGCATLTESTEQYVMVQTVLDHQQVAGIGCVLSNDTGRWFVTSPGRVRIRKSTQPLTVDCRLDDVVAYDQIGPKQNSSRWGNILLTAGTGQFVDRQTGAGFDYPGTLTVLLKRVAPAKPPTVPAPPPAAAPPPPPSAPQPPGGSAIY
ncbi:hypothetical protein [Pseudoduganella umbonata]|uniref:Uncharacterized protein n=1 Tax=Pseudoduganella umbonata TaxID=864828 RepID=A0A7W5EDK0_9BURK|nr:hypothetical protein [Pseudoduganella umbonata]MBB3223146.1 hypothetical protein [Pseudoduganella umbonata]